MPPGSAFDLFRGTAAGARDEVETFPTQLDRQIKFGAKSHPECTPFSPDGQLLATGSGDGGVRVFSRSGTLRQHFTGHRGGIFVVRWNRRGDLLASCSTDGSVIAWEARTGAQRQQMAHHSGAVLDLDWRNNGMLATAGQVLGGRGGPPRAARSQAPGALCRAPAPADGGSAQAAAQHDRLLRSLVVPPQDNMIAVVRVGGEGKPMRQWQVGQGQRPSGRQPLTWHPPGPPPRKPSCRRLSPPPSCAPLHTTACA